ncbi:MAG: ComF family protein [Schwartzia sp.]|nr:ComF family protein [Schwartzia sp. (in: firmicutes)]
MAGLWEAIWCFLFPPRCPACGDYTENRGGWCPDCLARTLTPRLLPLGAEERRFLDSAWALGRYHDTLRSLILPLKYRGHRDRLPYIRTFLAAAGAKLPEPFTAPGIAVPVPLHREKETKRGFNQSELIFRDWLTARGWQWQRALVRVRPTRPQHGLDPAERAANLKGAFAPADDAHIQDQPVLLVDDIFTTGATALTCARELKKAGASRVDVLTLASDRL